MANVEYIHICDYAFAAEGNKPCVIGIFEHITGPVFPLTHSSTFIAIQIRGTAHETMPLRIELGRPNGDVLAGVDSRVAMDESGAAFIAFHLVNTQFPEAGRYTVKVLASGRTLVSQSLHLRKGPLPRQSAQPESDPKKIH